MTTLLMDGLNFPEGPAFDQSGGIWLVEKDAGNLVYLRNNQHLRIYVGGNPNGIAIDQNGIIWFCDSRKNAIRQYDPTNGKQHTLVDCINKIPLKMPNDLCFDLLGNLLFTCPGDSLDDGTGYICCLSLDGHLIQIHTKMQYPNGLAFAPDNKSLYIAETGSKWIWKSTWNVSLKKLEDLEKFAYAGGEVGPDGIAFDSEGTLYAAIYGGQKIITIDHTGQILEEILLPYPNPTNCAIDPKGTKGIIVTEAKQGQLIQIDSNKKGLL